MHRTLVLSSTALVLFLGAFVSQPAEARSLFQVAYDSGATTANVPSLGMRGPVIPSSSERSEERTEGGGRATRDDTFATRVEIAQMIPSRGENITRSVFLEEAVAALYGADIETFSTPFTKVPRSSAQAVGLARRVGALPQRWGSEEVWNAPISRCESLSVLFSLAQITPQAYGNKEFRDVRGLTQTRHVQQGLAWNLLQPLTPRYFGCGRVLAREDLNTMMRNLVERVQIPLDIPEAALEERAQPAQRFAPRTRTRTRTTPARRTRTPRRGEARITVEIPGIDQGRRKSLPKELPKNDVLQTMWGLIQSRFLYQERIDEKKIADAIAKALVKELEDPYSEYMPPKQAENFRNNLQGELSGIGAQVESSNLGGVTVITPLTGSPALGAGVKPGDRITHVDGVSILEDTLQEAVEKIRGPVGSKVELTIQRETGKILITIVRDKIVIPEIETSVQDNVLVIRLLQFGDKSRRELTGMIEEGLHNKPLGIILDLRNNPGGLLDAAIDVASHFLPGETLVAQIRERDDLRTEHTRAGRDIVPKDLPVVVLVNKGSASASEIVAGALQDYERAKIVGVTTFGKGTVQEVVQLHGGESMKFTIAEWLTPNGRTIQDNGVEPDIVVEMAEQGGRDEQLLEAIRVIKAKAR